MERASRWNYAWIYYLTAGILFGSAVLRSLLAYQDTPAQAQSLGLLSLGVVLFIFERHFSRKWPISFYIYLIIQVVLIVTLLYMPEPSDYFAMLFSVLAMQLMQHFEPKQGVIWIVMFAPIMFVPLMRNYVESQALAFTLVYTAVSAFMAAYSLATRRAQQERSRTEALALDLQEANEELQSYANQLERLAVTTERNRLARELHDSVTQTIFSMTLTTQSALMLLERDKSQVQDQLSRLYELTRSATSEMQTLMSELQPEYVTEDGLAEAIRQHLTGGHLPESLSIDLQVDGDQPLEVEEAKGLFRIVQEALNNTIKHASTDHAQIKLHLVEPVWLEIVDNGIGFDQEHSKGKMGVGLASMNERAQEIGWQLHVTTSPGKGTCIRVERPILEIGRHHGEAKTN
jgi:signal transduction histidine kinase